MPIILGNVPNPGQENDGQNTALGGFPTNFKVYTPKFFSKALTGSGKTTGMLCTALNPACLSWTPTTTDEHIVCKKEHYVNGQTSVDKVPLNPLNYAAWDRLETLPIPEKVTMGKIGTATLGTGANAVACEFYTDLRPHSIIVEETSNGPAAGGGTKSKKVSVCYQLFLFGITDWNNKGAKNYKRGHPRSTVTNHFESVVKKLTKVCNTGAYMFTCDPVGAYSELLTLLDGIHVNLDRKELRNYIDNYSVYDAITRRAEEWQTNINDLVGRLARDTGKNVPKNYVYRPTNSSGMLLPQPGGVMDAAMTMTTQVEYLENYPVPLDLYRDIYAAIQAAFPPSMATEIYKHNLNLLLSDTMYTLDKQKPQLTPLILPPNPKPPLGPKTGVGYSPEQSRAITCTDPLVLVQSGAGSGKSSVILGRVAWMTANGVDPKSIMVISFTNAAADNIVTKNSDIQSMTIAKMIHTIYSLNFPTHELSTAETLGNTLDIYYPNDPLANSFRKRVQEMESKKSNDQGAAYREMNNFVEQHLQDILKFLNGVCQTTLALEIIICYQMINQLKEPPELASKYLIIDEVQDNSVFEFIYALNYVKKHNEALFIVGDCSQTLYEFRASNPKALNVLEGSGVFTTHKLQTNYRSNQEILDFANVILASIEANQYARIQLQANSLKTVTEQSFRDAVKFQYHRILKVKDMEDNLPVLIQSCLKPYIDDCVRKGEQVCFLAYKRIHGTIFEKTVNELYPRLKIANITSDKSNPDTLFSSFIRESWNTLQFAPSQSFLNIVVAALQTKIAAYANEPKRAFLVDRYGRMLDDWRRENKNIIAGWQTQVNNNQMTLQDFMDNVKLNLLQYEIRVNAVKSAMLSSKKRDKDFNHMVETADILISTIHGAKGLEFPHTIVLFHNERELSEEMKRVYYVALTRAMKSEYVLAYDNVVSPQIKANYETIVQQLHQSHPAPNSGHVFQPLVTGVPSKTMNTVSIVTLANPGVQMVPGEAPKFDKDGRPIIKPVANTAPVLPPAPPPIATNMPAFSTPAPVAPASTLPPIATPPKPAAPPVIYGANPGQTAQPIVTQPPQPVPPVSKPVSQQPFGFNPAMLKLPNNRRGEPETAPAAAYSQPNAAPRTAIAPNANPAIAQPAPTGYPGAPNMAAIMASMKTAPKRQDGAPGTPANPGTAPTHRV